MKHTINLILVAIMAIFVTGCASTRMAEPVVFRASSPTETHPTSKSDYIGSNAYARHLVGLQEFEGAAYWFANSGRSVKTTDRLWEHENLINASIAYLLAGNLDASKAALNEALAMNAFADPDERSRYLMSLFNGTAEPGLPVKLRQTLPR